MKRNKWVFAIISMVLSGFLFIAVGCSKETETQTEIKIPKVITVDVTEITNTSAVIGGTVVHAGGSPVTERGVYWSTHDSPGVNDSVVLSGQGHGDFSVTLKGLAPNTKYYVRAFATNVKGTGYGEIISFVTLSDPVFYVHDIDGNSYRMVTIGTQTWMAENLKTTRFNDGTSINYAPNDTSWNIYPNHTKPKYCWYENDSTTNKETFGALYCWVAVNSTANGSRNICPAGWRVPTHQDWWILSDYLGGNMVSGGKLKEAGTQHWLSPNTDATNESGFSAIAAGYRTGLALFGHAGYIAYFWSSDESNSGSGRCRLLHYNGAHLTEAEYYKTTGMSVRCIRE